MTLFPGVALVTGAASGIGRQTAISFAVEGCNRIAVCDLNMKGLNETKALIDAARPGVDVAVLPADMTKEETVTAMFQALIEKFGRIDYAVNCAGIMGDNKRSTETEISMFDLIYAINVRGIWLCSRNELTQMLKQEPLPSHDGRRGNRGAIVNIASQLGIVSRPTAPAYNASKSAVISLTRSDAIDYSKDNIRVNCVCPGVIATPMTEGSAEQIERLKPAINIAPMERMGTAQEIADACLFLCSSKATFCQGSAMVVDGGYVIN